MVSHERFLQIRRQDKAGAGNVTCLTITGQDAVTVMTDKGEKLFTGSGFFRRVGTKAPDFVVEI
jgi:hypothetical protein